jgi:lipopolysaccharide export system protein LptC
MAQSFASYSRVVAWLKILLPLSALALLSTLFLFSRSIDPEQSIPFADVDVKQLAREPRITAPEFSGMTADGAAITISASTAKADPTNLETATIDRLVAEFQTPDGAEVTAQADQGAIEDARVARLAGNVHIQTSSGYRISTEELVSDLDKTLITSGGAVVATGPLGEIKAGQMIVSLQNQTGTSMLVFKNGIKVLYDPKNRP